MSEPLRPFRSDCYTIGASRDGKALLLCPLTPAAADVLGPQVAAFGPWAHYAFDAGRITAGFKGASDSVARYRIECGSDVAGVVVIVCPWLAGPYLQMLAVLPTHQGRGIGAAILLWLEAQARGHFRNLWLCVSGFDTEAQRFYRAHGFERVATIDGLVRDGDDELLMRKRLVW